MSDAMMRNLLEFRAKHFALLMSVLSILALLLAWEVVIWLVGDSFIPSPLQCMAALSELASKNILLPAISASLYRVLVGFSLALVVGIALGVLAGLSKPVKIAISGPIELLRPVPPIAWIPISIALLGIGNSSAFFVIFIGALFPILTNTTFGVCEVPKRLLDAARVFGASPKNQFRDVTLPFALPNIFAGARIALGFAWMCVIAAEMIAAQSGLGYQIQLDRQLLRLDRVIAGMFVIGLLGLLMNRLVHWVEWALLPWRRSKPKVATEKKPLVSELDPGGLNSTHKMAYFDAGPAGASLKVDQLSFGYPDGTRVLNDLCLNFAPGEFVSILGASGCGKTTLLRLLAGLESPTKGDVIIDTELSQDLRTDISMVFQDLALFPWRSVEANIAYGLEKRNIPEKVRRARVDSLLRLIGLRDKRTSYPSELSGGQQQRVALARAIAVVPRILLMDEPFTGLDSLTREELQKETAWLLKDAGVTVILVTHDIEEAAYLSNRVLLMPRELASEWQECIFDTRPEPLQSRAEPEYLQRLTKLRSLIRSADS